MSETLVQELLQQCSTCRSTKLLQTYFSKNVKGQYMKTCDKCRVRLKENKAKKVEYFKKYYQENKEKLLEYNKIYREENKEQISEKSKIYREDTKDKRAETHKIYREKNKEKLLERASKYYEENKDKVAEYNKKYNIENREKLVEDKKKYYQENKEAFSEKSKKYRKDKRHYCDHNTIKRICKICCPNGHLKHAVSRRVWDALKKNKSKKSLEYLGCDIQTFKEHIEKSFKENMSWDNHGLGDDCWNIDHIIPVLYKQDNIEPSIEEVGKRLHYTNCQALWQKENICKGNRFIG